MRSAGGTEPGTLVEFEVAALLEAVRERFAHPPLRAGRSVTTSGDEVAMKIFAFSLSAVYVRRTS